MFLAYSIFIAIGIGMVGIGGIGLGLGYLLKRREPGKVGTEGDFNQMVGRDKMFGYAAIISGLAVIAIAFAYYFQQVELYKLITR